MPIPRFHISSAVRDLGVRGAFAILDGLDNRHEPRGLAAWREGLVQRLRG